MAQTFMSVKEVAASLHVSSREVERMAEKRLLPAHRIKNEWRFKAGEIWNWIEENLHTLPEQRKRDRHPSNPADLLISTTLPERAVTVNLVAKTRSSLLRELAKLAASLDEFIDPGSLTEQLLERERQGSTALQDGVAVPHPARPVYSNGPIVVAALASQPLMFGERGGGPTDLFFLVCCPDYAEHLLYLGRLCRLLIDKELQARLRAADDAGTFTAAIHEAERALCASGTN